MQIHLLSQEVINQIAAGEVLERPSNLVKELIENSIDAGATQIDLDIDQGGRYVRIQDNGLGMNPEDLEKSILRHATSKLNKFSDLWSLSTYGFRGEALASAAAVSEMTIKSRTEKSKSAFVLNSKFGKTEALVEQSGEIGTTLTIENLFENVPARLKFLKTESAEVSQILKVVKAFALTHPKVSFKVRSKNVLKIFYPICENYLERAKLVLEEKELFETVSGNSDLKVHALFSSPNNVSRTAQNIWIFVQNRWIQDRALQRAILDSYQNLLMHGEYPSCVLMVSCDSQNIDVNIHPTKSQVKFQDPSEVFRLTYRTLRSELEKAPWLKNLFRNSQSNEFSENTNSENFSFHEKSASETNNYSLENTEEMAQNSKLTKIQEAVQSYSQQYQSSLDSVTPEFSYANFKKKNNFVTPQKNTESSQQFLDTSLEPLWASLQVLGQLNQTYIVAQSRVALFLIDQHASHERVMFEKLMKAWNQGEIEIQKFLIPLTLDLSQEKIEVLLNNKSSFEKIGIELEASSLQTISIYSAPAFIKESGLYESLIKMSQEILDHGGGFAVENKIKDIFSSMACHSAIRAGQALSADEMKELLVQMDEFPLSSFCPHGRPVYKQITFYELDKDFGRIV